MATKKFISLDSLTNFLNNLKSLFATKTEMNTKSDKAHTHIVADIANLQSVLDGKASSSHGIHVNYSTTAPVMDGAANVGSASTVARSDHRHPIDTSRASQTSLDSHANNTTFHITNTERANWNTAYTHSQVAHAPSNAEPNQNAFSNVKIGDVTISADTKTDTLTLVAGNNITLTPDATNDKITISAKDTTYTLGSFGVTATAAEINKLDGVTATTTEINYIDGVTSNIQTQLDGKANSSHTHKVSNISDLTATATELNYMEGVTSNVQTQFNTLTSTVDNKKAKRISLTGQCQTTSYRTSVIALCKAPTNASCGNASNSYSSGQLTFARSNGLYAPVIAIISMSSSHGATNQVRARYLCSSGFSIFKPCTFMHNEIIYGGLEVKTSDAEAHNVTFVGETSFDIFALDIYDSNKKVILNEEVYNSISYDNPIIESGWKDTGNTIITSANIGSQSVASATKDGSGNVITSTYEKKTDATTKLSEAKTYADNAANKVKNDLLNGAGGAYDTLKELGDLIDDNTDAIDALETVAAGKANKTHTHAISDVTNLQSTLNNKSDSGHTHNNIVSRGNTTAETETTRPSVSGLSMSQVYNNGYPQNYGNILNLKGQGDGQLLIGWSGTSGSHAPLHVRSKRDVSDAKWSDWAQIYTTAHKPTPTDIGAASSSHTHKVADLSDLTASVTELNYVKGVTSGIQTQLDGKAPTSHNHSASNITSGTLSSDRLPTVPVAKGGTGSTTAAGALTNLGITATASELNKLDGVTATTAELNYVDGVTSNIQTQLNGKSSTSHSHSAAGSSLGFVKSGGDVTISDGVITVNDDSHNHTIANIDNLQTTLNGKEDIISWSAITQGQTWSRICLVKANTSVVGWSGVLSVGFTRGNVVGNATFAINASHSSTVYITQLNANKYSTFKIRGVTDSNANNTYIEIYDTANSIASGTNQTMYCKFIPLLGCTVTKYTAFTSGATIPSGYTAGSTLTVDTSGGSMVASKFVGSLSGNATSATKSTQDGNGQNIVNTYATKTELNTSKSNLQTQIDGKSNTSHTHNYAGSSSAGGSATSAVKLQTARSIGLGNDLTGSANFDGSGNITISAKHYNTSVNSGNKSNYPYHRFAYKGSKQSPITGQFNDTDAIFCIRETYNGGGYGVLKVSLRTNNSTTTSQAGATWLARYNFALDDVKIGLCNVAGATYADLYIKVGSYARTTVIQLEGNRSWSLISSNEVNDTTTTDAKTSTECYATIETAATTLHGQAYSTIISSVDGGQVNYANSAGSATSATTASTCTGNSATATKLSSAKTISLTGDVSGSTSFDGNGNVSITTTIADDSHNHTIANIDNLQSALDGKSATSHTHTADNLIQWANALFGTNNQGGVEYSYGSDSGKNVLTEISNMGQGLHTAYAISGTTGNPKTNESFRFLIHKTSGTIGWILAWDAQGSLFTNYQSAANTFKGWKCVYDANPSALWTGGYYMSSSNSTPQTIEPSKKLSECRTGWVLVWSDYDPDTSTKNNTDIHHDYVFKKNCAGANWSGQCMLCDIPRYMGSNAQDVDTERRILKAIYIHDDRIEGSYQGSYDERNDVILRAVYEF